MRRLHAGQRVQLSTNVPMLPFGIPEFLLWPVASRRRQKRKCYTFKEMQALGFFKEHDAVLIIGSSHVSGAIVEQHGKNKPKILVTHESYFPVKSSTNSKVLTTHMLSAVHLCLSSLHKSHKRNIRTIQVVLASPWFSSFSKTISIKKPEPFLVNQKTVDSLVEEYFDSLSKSHADSQNFLVEKNMSHIRLNGYETANPYGHMAETVDISVYASLAPVAVKEQIESEIYTVLHPGMVSFHTFPFVAWNVLNSMFSPKEDIAFIDIGGETTDLLVVRRGAIQKSASLPIGINQLNRKIAAGLDTYPELAHSLISIYAAGIAEDGLATKIKTLATAFSEEWSAHFFQIFDEKSQEYFLPQKAYITSDRHIQTVFSEVIKKQIPDVVTLKRHEIAQFVDYAEIGEPSIFLVLAAVYASTIK